MQNISDEELTGVENVDVTEKEDNGPPSWLLDGLLFLVLLVGFYLRVVGVNWDEGQYLHPDERFLMFVESSIQPVESLGEYFDTANSSLNPHNSGHSLFVYGTWPIFMVRYALEWLDMSGGEVAQLGRPLSALVNILTVFLVYLIASRNYDRRIGVLAAAFASFSVLSIQLSHYFKEDTFMTFFTMLTLYFAVLVAVGGKKSAEGGPEDEDSRQIPEAGVQPGVMVAEAAGPSQPRKRRLGFLGQYFGGQIHLFIFFGLALGMAMASKINAVPIALALPVAVMIRISKLPEPRRAKAFWEGFGYLVLAAVVSFVTFRVLQPYSFSGPTILDIGLNPRWLDNMRELRGITSPDSIFGFPPSLQWANRLPVIFALENVIRWGLGIPLGLLAWAGFLWAGWRMIKGEWQLHILLWGWTAVYFLWQSTVFNPTMRYQLPVYPTLVIFAAWAIIRLWDRGRARTLWDFKGYSWAQLVAVILGMVVLYGTIIWALAFTGIYIKPVTRVAASRWIFENIPGPINLQVETEEGLKNQPVPVPYEFTLTPDTPFFTTFTAKHSGELSEVVIHRLSDQAAVAGQESFSLALAHSVTPEAPLAGASAVLDVPATGAGEPVSATFRFDRPVPIEAGEAYHLQLRVDSANAGAYSLAGAALANESTWDDGLPLRIDGFDGYGGIYQRDLNFEMYWEDNPEKLDRFLRILDDTDYVVISSSRQWGSVGRLPDRFPLSTTYYRTLIGCPEDRSIEDCYNQAEVGKVGGLLGFSLVKIFVSNPSFGPFEFNDQASEEAFTVYDHPKVFIFEKTEDYNSEEVRALLGAVDLFGEGDSDGAQAGDTEKDLLLPEERLTEQQTGGTWSELFPTDALINRSQLLSGVSWYLIIALVGLLAYPILRTALPGLNDKGYPLARTAGLLILSYLVWLGASLGLSFDRLTIGAVLLLMGVFAGILAYRQRADLRREIREKGRYFLIVEGLVLAFFLVGLIIRFTNPDLWHPWKGGEKPMDFSYFNAVLKSSSFPPYDPWFAGGYINYYYYGFVLMGVVVKFLGIIPAVAYNLILPTLFSLIAMGAFSIGWNLLQATRLRTPEPGSEQDPEGEDPGQQITTWVSPWMTGIAAALGMAILGNLGIVRMLALGYQRLAATGGSLDEAGFLTRVLWTGQGFMKSLGGSGLPYSLADWYWNPSRAIPAPNDIEPITEFPYFTFLYGDLHAHLIALPLSLLALGWALSVLLAKGRWKGVIGGILGMILGGLAIGALRPTNTWDFYPYLAIGMLAIAYAVFRYFRPGTRLAGESTWRALVVRAVAALAAAGILALLAHVLFQPYAQWYGQGYNSVRIWEGTHTPLTAYFVHWGVFLFFIFTWMAWETRDWMANTPLASLRLLEPYRGVIFGVLVLLLVWIGILIYFLQVNLAVLVLPLALWAGILILRPGLPDVKRGVLFLVGTGLVLTLMVEVIVLEGDIGRMNTVFKFYLQVWTLFAISAAGAFGWLLAVVEDWSPNWRNSWAVAAIVLVAAAALYPLMGSYARMNDRMTESAPNTLDGMAYMEVSTYFDLDTEMDLSQDYGAIRWLQENAVGSPVIVEGNMVEYHWGNRYTIYTGLPNVLGWNWHQRQQRAVVSSEQITDRLDEISDFYTTASAEDAAAFLRKYGVQYIIVGQLERALYPQEGFEKFERLNGTLWQEVYRDRDTVIYRVMGSEGSIG